MTQCLRENKDMHSSPLNFQNVYKNKRKQGTSRTKSLCLCEEKKDSKLKVTAHTKQMGETKQ